MNIQELRDFFIASDYSSETKELLAQILSNKTEVNPGLIFEIKDILQKELDVDFNELGVDVADDPEAKKIEKEYADELDVIQKDLNEDMSFVESELKDLDETRKEILKISDEMEAEEISKSI